MDGINPKCRYQPRVNLRRFSIEQLKYKAIQIEIPDLENQELNVPSLVTAKLEPESDDGYCPVICDPPIKIETENIVKREPEEKSRDIIRVVVPAKQLPPRIRKLAERYRDKGDPPVPTETAKPKTVQPKAAKIKPKQPVMKKQAKKQTQKEPKKEKRKRVTVKKYKPVNQNLLILKGSLTEMIPALIPNTIDQEKSLVWENVFNVKNQRYFISSD